jgi:hypothetical protein
MNIFPDKYVHTMCRVSAVDGYRKILSTATAHLSCHNGQISPCFTMIYKVILELDLWTFGSCLSSDVEYGQEQRHAIPSYTDEAPTLLSLPLSERSSSSFVLVRKRRRLG